MQGLRELTDAELDQVHGGAMHDVQVNGGGKTPKGEANGVPTVTLNPADHPPPGQQS
jgi:hypothetical protein